MPQFAPDSVSFSDVALNRTTFSRLAFNENALAVHPLESPQPVLFAPPGEKHFLQGPDVDGHFQKAGFEDRGILECHGSIHFLQCMRNCGRDVWSFPEDYKLSIDQNLHAREPLPSCPDCNGMARPNILMFSDYGWDSSRVEKQMDAFSSWVESNKSKSLVIVEMGAGLAVPTVRLTCEGILHAWENEVTFVRINPREVDPTHGVVNMRMGALAALKLLDQ